MTQDLYKGRQAVSVTIALAEVRLGFRPELVVERDKKVKNRRNQQKDISGASLGSMSRSRQAGSIAYSQAQSLRLQIHG